MIQQEPEGATRLDEEELEALKPTHISTREELNEWEQANIVEAELWAFRRKRSDVLTVEYVRELHFQMFGQTWEWAGHFRKSGKNIGVPSYEIPASVKNACEDAAVWVNENVHSLPEIAARFHHRLVYIHPFPNGNGRHARLIADILLFNHDYPRLSWGGVTLQREGEARTAYIQALKAADQNDFRPLLVYLGVETH